MPKHTYLNRTFFDLQRQKYKAIEEVSVEAQAVCLKTEDNKLLKIFHSLDSAKSLSERLEWLKALGAKDDVLYVCEPVNECTLTQYIKPAKGEKLFKWYYEKTGGIEYRLKIAYSIAARLQQIHSKGICLVDICPENTTLQAFSLEKKAQPSIQFIGADSISSYTYYAHSTGCPRYIDPLVYQYRTSPSSVSDTFSFAIMMFEMLTTCHPFYGEDAELL